MSPEGDVRPEQHKPGFDSFLAVHTPGPSYEELEAYYTARVDAASNGATVWMFTDAGQFELYKAGRPEPVARLTVKDNGQRVDTYLREPLHGQMKQFHRDAPATMSVVKRLESWN